MKKIILVSAFTVLLASVAYVGVMALIAYIPPARPIADYSVTPACEQTIETGNAYRGSDLQCMDRIREAALLKQYKNTVVRVDDDFVIRYAGNPVARLHAPRDGTDYCDALGLGKVLSVYDPDLKRMEAVTQIRCHFGEFERRFLVLPDGSRWNVADASASPNGKMIGVAEGEARKYGLTLYSWPDRNTVVHFPVWCRVLNWQTNSRLSVTCADYGSDGNVSTDTLPNPVAFDAIVWKADKKWHLQATRWLDATLWQFDNMGNVEHPPTFSLRSLPHYTSLEN